MTPPTAEDVRSWSQLNFARYGYADDTKLQVVVDRAVGYLVMVTGQDLAHPELSMNLTDSMFSALMGQAIQMRAEQVVMQGRQGHVDSAASNEVIASFTAGLYSESHRDPSRRGEQKSINTWPALDELLWTLMTADRFSYWFAYVTGTAIPQFGVEEVDWRGTGAAITFFEPWDRYVLAGYGDGAM